MSSPQQLEPSTRLNPVQLHLLELFSRDMGEAELIEVKELLLRYYALKVEEEVASAWTKKGYTKASFKKATRNLHLRRKKMEAAA